jgi:uncharacterized Rossmann fold enzyme
MHFKIIDELKRAEPKRRHTILTRMREKNLRHLQKHSPQLAELLTASGTGRYEIRIDRDFLEIIDKTTGQPCHPPKDLLAYMRHLGFKYHDQWIEKNAITLMPRGTSEHGLILNAFREHLLDAQPELKERLAAGNIRLPPLPDGRGFSGPTVFLGIFTGLQIMFYLERNEARDVFLIEPDFEKFAVSCFFLDYELIHQYYGRLLLHVGGDLPQNPVDLLIHTYPITAASWTRLLPAYPDAKCDELIGRIGLTWSSLNEIFVPFDREVRNLSYAMRNLKRRALLMGPPPELSTESVIAVVVSGPSLIDDLPWLHANQGKLIIFSATSTVRVLQHHQIRIDFQFALDTEFDEETLLSLKLDPDIPLVAYYKINPELAARFKQVLLVVEKSKSNPVNMQYSLTGTHPTTGNQAVALANWCQPSRLLLVGFDLGFREAAKSHVLGSAYDDNDGAAHLAETSGRLTLPVATNFPESEGQIVAHSYYNSARLSLESTLAAFKNKGGSILNLSDGAQIAGAVPCRSADYLLPDYAHREKDTRRIAAAFSAEHADAWKPYATSGTQQLKAMGEAVEEALQLERFVWTRWAECVDKAWAIAWQKTVTEDGDGRMEAYRILLQDLLADWYRLALLSASTAEAESLYRLGKEALHAALSRLVWPEDIAC